MGERVARIRVDGGQRGFADRAVIRVRDAQPVPVDLRGRREHPLRAYAADLAADVAAQLDAGRDPTVRVAEEREVLHAELGRRGLLLGLAERAHLGARGVVEAARVAGGADAVRDLHALGDPACDRAGSAEVDVVRMGDDDQRTLDRRRGLRHGMPRNCLRVLSSDCFAAMPAPPPRRIARMSGVRPPLWRSNASNATAAVPPATFHRPDTYSLVAPPETPRLRA